MKKYSHILGFGAIAVLMMSSSIAYAATFLPEKVVTRIDPSRIGQQQSPESDLQAAATTVPKVLVPAPKKQVLTPAEKKITFNLVNLSIQGNTIFSSDDLKPIYAPYLNKTITLAELQKIANDITLKYRNAGYFLSRAVIPPQKIKNGNVNIVVVEGFIDQVSIQGKVSNSAAKLLNKYLAKIQASRPLRSQDLERYVLLANDLPGISVQTVLSPASTKLGATDLSFVVKQKHVKANFDFNNYGTRYLGPNQIDANVAVNSVFGAADQLGFYAMVTPDNNNVRFGQAYYYRPLGSDGTTMNLIADYTETHPGFLLDPLELKGESEHFEAQVSHPFMRSRRENLYVNATLEWLDSKTNAYITDPETLMFQDKIGSARVEGIYNFADQWQGVNTFSTQLSQGLGGTSEDDPHSSRYGGKSTYTKINLYASRLQALPHAFSALLAAEGQYAFDPLLSPEEFGFGGRDFGRGYDPSELTGDSGLAGKLELRWTKSPGYQWLQRVQLFSFFDAGTVWNKGNETETGQYGNESGTSTGMGMSLMFINHIKANLELDKPLTYAVQAEKLAGHSGYGWRGYFNLAATF
ncbi:MAG: ShlB/FhaC/HecB family hemolysin secretion/activation protein [Gammaproteobacteria bacterium]|nr:ShlB/FhaC/HecB family hemolysin secretion/activation protein [Gammaproteobacteria bacterium]